MPAINDKMELNIVGILGYFCSIEAVAEWYFLFYDANLRLNYLNSYKIMKPWFLFA